MSYQLFTIHFPALYMTILYFPTLSTNMFYISTPTMCLSTVCTNIYFQGCKIRCFFYDYEPWFSPKPDSSYCVFIHYMHIVFFHDIMANFVTTVENATFLLLYIMVLFPYLQNNAALVNEFITPSFHSAFVSASVSLTQGVVIFKSHLFIYNLTFQTSRMSSHTIQSFMKNARGNVVKQVFDKP